MKSTAQHVHCTGRYRTNELSACCELAFFWVYANHWRHQEKRFITFVRRSETRVVENMEELIAWTRAAVGDTNVRSVRPEKLPFTAQVTTFYSTQFWLRMVWVPQM